jgi:hypothetical protein
MMRGNETLLTIICRISSERGYWAAALLTPRTWAIARPIQHTALSATDQGSLGSGTVLCSASFGPG